MRRIDKGTNFNFNSYIVVSYAKVSVKTFIARALKYSSDWKLFHCEIQRFRQVLVDNHVPSYTVEATIKKTYWINLLNEILRRIKLMR